MNIVQINVRSIERIKITLDNKLKKKICICDEYVINLFASMKLEMEPKKITWL